MNIVSHRALATALLCLGLAAPDASAGTISIDSFFKGVPVGYTLDNPQAGQFFAADGLGSVVMSNAQGVAGFPFGGSFEAYCADILGDIFDPGTSTQTVPATVNATAAAMSGWTDPNGLGSAGAGAKAAWLYNTYNPLIAFVPGATTVTFAALGVSAAADVARTALAMSLWEVLYETAATYSVSDGAGAFFVWCDTTSPAYNPFTTGCGPRPQGTVVTLANSFLATLGANTDTATWLQLSNPNEDVQDFIGPAPAVAPEPATLGLLVVGAAVCAVRRRRG